jgi:hypothetical protein
MPTVTTVTTTAAGVNCDTFFNWPTYTIWLNEEPLGGSWAVIITFISFLRVVEGDSPITVYQSTSGDNHIKCSEKLEFLHAYIEGSVSNAFFRGNARSETAKTKRNPFHLVLRWQNVAFLQKRRVTSSVSLICT